MSFFFFFNINLVRANLQDAWKKQDQFNRSENCSWENAQFENFYGDRRYCIDYSDGRVFMMCDKNITYCLKRNGDFIYKLRMEGFLNRAENVLWGNYGQRYLHYLLSSSKKIE